MTGRVNPILGVVSIAGSRYRLGMPGKLGWLAGYLKEVLWKPRRARSAVPYHPGCLTPPWFITEMCGCGNALPPGPEF